MYTPHFLVEIEMFCVITAALWSRGGQNPPPVSYGRMRLLKMPTSFGRSGEQVWRESLQEKEV